jgi:hypothetical protein
LTEGAIDLQEALTATIAAFSNLTRPVFRFAASLLAFCHFDQSQSIWEAGNILVDRSYESCYID